MNQRYILPDTYDREDGSRETVSGRVPKQLRKHLLLVKKLGNYESLGPLLEDIITEVFSDPSKPFIPRPSESVNEEKLQAEIDQLTKDLEIAVTVKKSIESKYNSLDALYQTETKQVNIFQRELEAAKRENDSLQKQLAERAERHSETQRNATAERHSETVRHVHDTQLIQRNDRETLPSETNSETQPFRSPHFAAERPSETQNVERETAERHSETHSPDQSEYWKKRAAELETEIDQILEESGEQADEELSLTVQELKELKRLLNDRNIEIEKSRDQLANSLDFIEEQLEAKKKYEAAMDMTFNQVVKNLKQYYNIEIHTHELHAILNYYIEHGLSPS